MPTVGGSQARRAERRARRWLSRDRPRIAERWLTAALASAGRHESAADVAGIELHLAQLLVDAGRFSEASVRVWRVIKSTGLAWPVYAELAAVWADVTIASGKLPEADAWLQSVQAESIVRGVAAPASVRTPGASRFLARNLSPDITASPHQLRAKRSVGWLFRRRAGKRAAWRRSHVRSMRLRTT